MRCLSCGAEHSFRECPPQASVIVSAPSLSTQEVEPDPLDLEDENAEMTRPPMEARPPSRLIEFPGVTRRAVPQWRKELSERVREVQERRAREAAAEAEEAERMEKEKPTTSAPQLELLRQA